MGAASLRITSRVDYGLRAVVDLAMQADATVPTQAHEVARRQDIPDEYLSQIMALLRKGGLVRAVRGVGGGYCLARDPRTLSVAQVVEALEGPVDVGVAPGGRTNAGAYGKAELVVREAWDRAVEAALQALRNMTIQDLCNEVRELEPMPDVYVI